MIKQTPLQDDNVLVFLHIPKTAGTSFKYVLQQHFTSDEVTFVPREVIDNVNKPKEYLAPYKLIAGHNQYNIRKHLRKKPIFITMLRHPVERTISAYYHARRDQNHAFNQLALDNDLESFLKINLVRNSVANLMSRYIFNDAPWYELSNHIPTIKQRLESMHFVGVTDFFEESLILLHYMFGWEYEQSAPKLNVAQDRLPQHDIPLRVIQDIRSINKVDLEIYDFAKHRFIEKYRKFAINALTKHSTLNPTIESTQYIDELLQKTTQFKDRIRYLENHNQQLEKLVNTPGILEGIYRSLIPLSWRLYLHDLRNGGR